MSFRNSSALNQNGKARTRHLGKGPASVFLETLSPPLRSGLDGPLPGIWLPAFPARRENDLTRPGKPESKRRARRNGSAYGFSDILTYKPLYPKTPLSLIFLFLPLSLWAYQQWDLVGSPSIWLAVGGLLPGRGNPRGRKAFKE
jgi:hypothetical protein